METEIPLLPFLFDYLYFAPQIYEIHRINIFYSLTEFIKLQNMLKFKFQQRISWVCVLIIELLSSNNVVGFHSKSLILNDLYFCIIYEKGKI
jgi:hypothetical protein